MSSSGTAAATAGLGHAGHEPGKLEDLIEAGIRITPIRNVRNNSSYGVNCLVEFTLRGIGAHGSRAVKLRTIWELAEPDSAPRLVSAFLKP